MLTFPYAVKYNGVIYPANTPIKEVKAEPLETPKGAPKKPPAKRKGD